MAKQKGPEVFPQGQRQLVTDDEVKLPALLFGVGHLLGPVPAQIKHIRGSKRRERCKRLR